MASNKRKKAGRKGKAQKKAKKNKALKRVPNPRQKRMTKRAALAKKTGLQKLVEHQLKELKKFGSRIEEKRFKHRIALGTYRKVGLPRAANYRAWCELHGLQHWEGESAWRYCVVRAHFWKDTRKIKFNFTQKEIDELPTIQNMVSVNAIISTIRSAYTVFIASIEEYEDKSNPFNDDLVLNFLAQCEDDIPKQPPKKAKNLTCLQFWVVIAACLECLPLLNALRTICFLVISTALVWRANETLRLTCDMIGLETRPINDDSDCRPCLIFPCFGRKGNPKANVKRAVIPSYHPVANVAGWLYLYHSAAGITHGPVIQGSQITQPATTAMINNDLKKVSKYLGEQGHEELSQFLTTHMCRRTGATFMLIAGGTAEEIKFAGGWLSNQYIEYLDLDFGSGKHSAAGRMNVTFHTIFKNMTSSARAMAPVDNKLKEQAARKRSRDDSPSFLDIPSFVARR